MEIETIKATEFTQEATVITLVFLPTIKEQENLFNINESIVLEF